MTGRGIDQILPYPGDPYICEFYVKSARDYVVLAEKANGPVNKPVPFAYIWGDALAELEREAPDARIVNLETSVTTSDACTDKGISYRMNPANIPCLTAAKIDCCALANNHVLDWGRDGLLETLDSLNQAGIKTAGAGRTVTEAEAPATIDLPGKGRALVFAFGMESSGVPGGWAARDKRPGVNFLGDLSDAALARIAARVREVKRPGDVAVASIHWGANWGYGIPRAQRRFAHGLIDRAGIDIVHGHSSHHAKGIEVHNKRPIFYGCGDFLNDYEGIPGYERYRDDLVLMYFLSVAVPSGELVHCRMAPMRIKNLRLNRASKEDAEWLRKVLSRVGERLGTAVESRDDGRLELRWS